MSDLVWKIEEPSEEAAAAAEAAGFDVAAALEDLVETALTGDREATEEARAQLLALFQDAVAMAAEYGHAAGINSTLEVVGESRQNAEGRLH